MRAQWPKTLRSGGPPSNTRTPASNCDTTGSSRQGFREPSVGCALNNTLGLMNFIGGVIWIFRQLGGPYAALIIRSDK